MDRILEWDRSALVFLNNLGSESWDGFWLFVTTIWYWSPLLVLSLYLVYRSGGPIALLRSFLSALLLGLFVLWSTARIKERVGRLRPINDPEVQGLIRGLKQHDDFSFFSGHASFSFLIAMLFFWQFRMERPWLAWIWVGVALLVSYSRIYLGVHFPLDVMAGAGFGSLIATSSFLRSQRRLNALRKPSDHPEEEG